MKKVYQVQIKEWMDDVGIEWTTIVKDSVADTIEEIYADTKETLREYIEASLEMIEDASKLRAVGVWNGGSERVVIDAASVF